LEICRPRYKKNLWKSRKPCVTSSVMSKRRSTTSRDSGMDGVEDLAAWVWELDGPADSAAAAGAEEEAEAVVAAGAAELWE
jgi:hypothetical protein